VGAVNQTLERKEIPMNDDLQIIKAPIEAVVAWLENRPNRGAKMIGVISRTLPPMNVKSRITKEPNPFLPEGVIRIAHRTVCIGASFEAAVNRQRLSEADPMDEIEYFHAGQLWGGKGEHASAYTVRHKPSGKLYFAYRPSQDRVTGFPTTISDQWTSAKTGEVLNHEDLKQYLKPPSKARNQEVDRPVPWRTLTLSNVQELFFAKHRFIIEAA
jgi:hypothetical protein